MPTLARLARARLAPLLAGATGLLLLSGGCDDGGSSSRGRPGGGGGGGGGAVAIARVNGATSPVAELGLGIVIEGSGFGDFVPGGVSLVRFTQGVGFADVSPGAAAWTDTAIRVVVPSSGSAGAFVAGDITIQVLGALGISNEVSVPVVAAPFFTFAAVSWTPATDLPAPRRAHRAATVSGGPGAGWLFVVGGNDGAENLASVVSNAILAGGSLAEAASWTAQPSLPSPRAFHDVAVADAQSAPVSATAAFLYVVGGQPTHTALLAGSADVLFASVDRTSGSIATWTATTPLPEPLIAPRAVVANGRLFVAGGTRPDGTPSAKVHAAPIGSDGSLGAFTSSSAAQGTDLPAGVSFHALAAHGGLLYVLRGDTGAITDPFAAASTLRSAQTLVAALLGGRTTAWTTLLPSTRARAKGEAFLAGNQALVAGGLLNNPTQGESERAQITSAALGTVSSWTDQSSGTQPNMFLFNGASARMPGRTASGNPQFYLIGGDATFAPGTPSASVKRTALP